MLVIQTAIPTVATSLSAATEMLTVLAAPGLSVSATARLDTQDSLVISVPLVSQATQPVRTLARCHSSAATITPSPLPALPQIATAAVKPVTMEPDVSDVQQASTGIQTVQLMTVPAFKALAMVTH